MTKRRNEPALSNFLKNGLGGSQLKASDRDWRRLRRPSRFETMCYPQAQSMYPALGHSTCSQPCSQPLVSNHLFPTLCLSFSSNSSTPVPACCKSLVNQGPDDPADLILTAQTSKCTYICLCIYIYVNAYVYTYSTCIYKCAYIYT